MAKTTLRKVKTALDSLPEELDRTYDQVLQRIQAQDRDHAVLALKVLGWIHHAVRPLGTRSYNMHWPWSLGMLNSTKMVYLRSA